MLHAQSPATLRKTSHCQRHWIQLGLLSSLNCVLEKEMQIMEKQFIIVCKTTSGQSGHESAASGREKLTVKLILNTTIPFILYFWDSVFVTESWGRQVRADRERDFKNISGIRRALRKVICPTLQWSIIIYSAVLHEPQHFHLQGPKTAVLELSWYSTCHKKYCLKSPSKIYCSSKWNRS